MRNLSLSIIGLLAILFFTQCEKDDNNTDTNTPNTPTKKEIYQEGLIWDNSTSPSGEYYVVSTELQGLEEGARILNAADDFFVEEGHSWAVDSFLFRGDKSAMHSTVLDSFGVIIYNDSLSQPNNIIYRGSFTSANINDVRLALKEPLTLNSGSYWITVFAIYNEATALSNARWEWHTGDEIIGKTAMVQNQLSIPTPFSWVKLPEKRILAESCHFQIIGINYLL